MCEIGRKILFKRFAAFIGSKDETMLNNFNQNRNPNIKARVVKVQTWQSGTDINRTYRKLSSYYPLKADTQTPKRHKQHKKSTP